MNYSLHYNRLIQRAPKEKPATYITEGHHIIPKCIGGTDADGIVYLTPEEHYVAHLLLIKMYPNKPKLIFAAHMMTVNGIGQNRTNNKKYGWVKRKISEQIKGKPKSEEHRKKLAEANRRRKGIPRSPEVKAKLKAAMKGKPGKKHTQETKLKMSMIQKGLKKKPGKKLTEEHKRNISLAHKGKKCSEEHRKKISLANKGRIHTEQSLQNMREGRKGKKLTEEHKNNISKANKGKIRNELSRQNIKDGIVAARARKKLFMNSSFALAETLSAHQAILHTHQNSNQ